MRVCVFGAGAIGGHLAARLAAGGAEVSVVARGAQLDAIRGRGLVVHAPGGMLRARPAASAEPSDLGPQDAVVVTVKAPALPAVAAGIAPLLRPDTAVAFVMNGIPWWYFQRHGGPHDDARLPRLDPGDALRRAVGPERVIGGVVYSACTVTEPGVVAVESARSRVVLGEPSGAASPRAEALAAALRGDGMAAEVTQRIRDRVWAKLLLNLGTGPMAVLGDCGPAELFTEDAVVEATRRIVAEGAAVARAWGCEVSPDAEGQIARGRESRHEPSIVQDLDLGRPMEIDALFAAPLELARMADVPTPTLDLVVALARVRARAAGLYAG